LRALKKKQLKKVFLPGLAGLFFCLKQTMNKEIKNIKKLIDKKTLELN
jgi:hypothetical protein